MSKTRQAGYTCYTCSEDIIFHSKVRYNLDGSIHLCKHEDKIAYGKYCEYLEHDKHARWIGWLDCGEHFWEWKRKIYDPRVEEEEARRRREEEAEALEILGLRKDLFLNSGPKAVVAERE